MIEVRVAQARDADALGEVHAVSWRAAYGSLFQPDFTARSVESRRGRWHERIAEGVGPILLAELDHRPLALSFSVPSSPAPGLAEIYSFYGHPDGWGTGVAAALMTETLRVLHGIGHTDVHLWTLKSTAQSPPLLRQMRVLRVWRRTGVRLRRRPALRTDRVPTAAK